MNITATRAFFKLVGLAACPLLMLLAVGSIWFVRERQCWPLQSASRTVVLTATMLVVAAVCFTAAAFSASAMFPAITRHSRRSLAVVLVAAMVVNVVVQVLFIGSDRRAVAAARSFFAQDSVEAVFRYPRHPTGTKPDDSYLVFFRDGTWTLTD